MIKKKVQAKARAKPKSITKSKVKKPAKSTIKFNQSRPKRPAGKAAVKKAKKKKESASSSIPRPGIIRPLNSVLLGFVEDYFAKIGVIALTLKAPLALGQTIHVLGHTTNLQVVVDSMQTNHVPVVQAGLKDGVGIKVVGRARAGDHVYLLK